MANLTIFLFSTIPRGTGGRDKTTLNSSSTFLHILPTSLILLPFFCVFLFFLSSNRSKTVYINGKSHNVPIPQEQGDEKNNFEQQQYHPAHFMNISKLANNTMSEVIQPLTLLNSVELSQRNFYSWYVAVTIEWRKDFPDCRQRKKKQKRSFKSWELKRGSKRQDDVGKHTRSCAFFLNYKYLQSICVLLLSFNMRTSPKDIRNISTNHHVSACRSARKHGFMRWVVSEAPTSALAVAITVTVSHRQTLLSKATDIWLHTPMVQHWGQFRGSVSRPWILRDSKHILPICS